MRYLPIVLFILVGALLGWGLTNDPSKLPSAIEGQSVPAFSLIDMDQPGELVTEADIAAEYVLINFWGTWCPSCRIEHPYLNKLKEQGVKIYGVDYKDKLEPAKKWLSDLGDPYEMNIFDPQGRLGFDMGVTGAPETFLISPDGTVLLRYQGVMSAEVWDTKFLPLIK